MVRVVVVSHNACDLTLACLRSVLATKWPRDRLEVVLVDNASTEAVVPRVRDELPTVRVIANTANLGFGAANNCALRDRSGVQYFALVNNDATVCPDWLAPLVEAIEADPSLGAACPKILLSSRFVPVVLRSTTHQRGRGDRRQLGVRLSGARVGDTDVWPKVKTRNGFWGPERGGDWTGSEGELLVPVPPEGASVCQLRLDSEVPVRVDVSVGARSAQLDVGRDPTWFPIHLGGAPIDVVNSVGSEWTEDGFGADRGYLEPDDGQYDQSQDVFAWSGAAVLLASAYLDDVGLFDERLFLYYEDLELAWRGRQRGWKYRFVPQSTVRHVHSATSVEASPTTRRLNERNRLLVLTRYGGYRLALHAIRRYVLVTGSYARRDVIAPLLRGHRPDARVVELRLRALAGYARRVFGYLPRRGP
jgi:GT2 family glycosyltransferase